MSKFKMDEILEEEMGHLDAEERLDMSKKLRRWSRQLAASVKAMKAAKTRTASKINWLGVEFISRN